MKTEDPTTGQNDTLRSFLQEEIENVKRRLEQLKGKIKQADFESLQDELKEKDDRLELLSDTDDNQLFLLRRDIGMLREGIEARTVKQRWWTRIPRWLWLGIPAVLVILCFAGLAFVQLRNPDKIHDYAATQAALTATAMPTATATLPATPVFTFTPVTPGP